MVKNHGVLDYKKKKIHFVDNVGRKRTLVGKNKGVSLRFILSLEYKRSMRNIM